MILAPNHFSFMDHFLMGCYLRRKIHFMAKSQMFTVPLQMVFEHGGTFPVRRGARDEETFITAETILARGGTVAMYCEGGRSRTGKLAEHGQAGDRAPGAGERRAGGPDRDPRLPAGAQLAAAAVPRR